MSTQKNVFELKTKAKTTQKDVNLGYELQNLHFSMWYTAIIKNKTANTKLGVMI